MENTQILRIISEYTDAISSIASEEEVCRKLTQKVISQLGLEDCVIYLLDESSGLLQQVAAHGPKSTFDFDIVDPITIRPGYGIVGAAFINGKHELVDDTRRDTRYMVDDRLRLSELAVPIMIGDKSIGVIDSEHSGVAFYKEYHLLIFKTLAGIAANKIEQIRALASARKINQILEINSYELLKKNDQLEVLNAQMDELIYSITHDFRTPILASMGIADMMIQEGALTDELHPMLKTSLTKLDNILQSVHLFYRVKRRLVAISEFSLNEMVGSSLSSLEDSLKNFRVIREIDESIIVNTDSFRLRLCLDQLIKNCSLFAYQPDGENVIRLDSMVHATEVILRLQDTGPGIPDYVLESSTKLLRRGNSAGKGLGLGLAIVREAADSGGMQLNYRNLPAGGLLVEITIPMRGNQ
jgi:signal transduction histidine kinase